MSNRKTALLIGTFLLAAALSLLVRILDDREKGRGGEAGTGPDSD